MVNVSYASGGGASAAELLPVLRAERGRKPIRRALGLRIDKVLSSRLVSALVAPRDVDDYLALIDPAWSVREVRARVVELRPETSDTMSLVLEPNAQWRGFRAGQYVLLCVTLAGVRHTRCFSLSSGPDDGFLRLTIKLLAGGRVSQWLRQEARVGDLVELSQAQGAFVLPERVPGELLFITAGSGITPAISIAHQLEHAGYAGALTWIHYARDEVILERELAQLALRHFVRLVLLRTGNQQADPAPHFSLPQLDALCPDWHLRESYVCGPPGLLATTAQLWEQRGLSHRLHQERFTAGPLRIAKGAAHGPHRVSFARSGRALLATADAPLLAQAEAAGLSLASGCRMGICHTCACRKISGSVHNGLSGELCDEPNQEIRLCISTPCSDVILDL